MSDIVHAYADGTYYFDEPGVYRFENGVAYKVDPVDARASASDMKCKYCGEPVVFTGHTANGFATDYVHANMIRRCSPVRSGRPYGVEADYEAPVRPTVTYPKGTKKPCVHPTCGFWVMYTDLGWCHIDTHGADVSGHDAKPLITRNDRDD
jgi:hypothetical protein